MKPLIPILAAIFTSCLLAHDSRSAVLVDDDWDDGDRTETNLPDESAWYASSAITTPTLSSAIGTLTGNVRMFETNTGSRLWISHFTPAGAPVELALGETLKITATFSAANITTSPATSRGLRIGLFNFSEPGATRVSADGFSTGSGAGAPGANVTGYILNMNFAPSFTINNPLQIMKRTDTATNNLMGASAVFTALSSGGGLSGTPGFANGVTYTMEFSAKRFEATTEITTKFFDDSGWNISHTATDVGAPTFRFDGFAVRANGVADTADSITFSRFKAEVLPFETRITSVAFTIVDGLTLTWASLPGKTYNIEWRSSLDPTDQWATLDTVASGGTSTSFSDIEAPFYPNRFYQIVEIAAP